MSDEKVLTKEIAEEFLASFTLLASRDTRVGIIKLLEKQLAAFTKKLGKDSPKSKAVAKRLDDEKANLAAESLSKHEGGLSLDFNNLRGYTAQILRDDWDDDE